MTKTGRGMFNTINLEAALRLYYKRIELSNDDIREIFGPMSSSTMSRLKKLALKQMAEDGASPMWDARCVHTGSAFKAWKLDPADLEMRLAKLRKLGLEEGE